MPSNEDFGVAGMRGVGMVLSVGLASEEQGRELKATELKAQMVVVVKFPSYSQLISLFVSEVDIMRHTVTFWSGVLGFRSKNRYDQNGVVYDSVGKTIHVYEFLGEV